MKLSTLADQERKDHLYLFIVLHCRGRETDNLRFVKIVEFSSIFMEGTLGQKGHRAYSHLHLYPCFVHQKKRVICFYQMSLLWERKVQLILLFVVRVYYAFGGRGVQTIIIVLCFYSFLLPNNAEKRVNLTAVYVLKCGRVVCTFSMQIVLTMETTHYPKGSLQTATIYRLEDTL